MIIHCIYDGIFWYIREVDGYLKSSQSYCTAIDKYSCQAWLHTERPCEIVLMKRSTTNSIKLIYALLILINRM